MSTRSNALADRLEQGAQALVTLAEGLSDIEWRTPLPKDGRPLGVLVHHVASVFPLEIQLALTQAEGKPIVGVTFDDVHAMNAEHAKAHKGAAKGEAIALLRANAKAAAAAIRALSDDQLDLATPNSMYGDAVLTTQFMLEDHAVRHSVHHGAKIRAYLAAARTAKTA